MNYKDHFSGHADDYQRFRPVYSPSFIEALTTHCRHKRHAWDCGTGNGQAARLLAPHFERITATDASEAMIQNAQPQEGVAFRVATAESSGLPDGDVDLINVAQAAHWFDHDAFYQEVRRVAASDCVLILSTYSLCRVNPEINAVLDAFYQEMWAYWPPERKYIDEAYQTIPFPFEDLPMPQLSLEKSWDLAHLMGYLATWSALRLARKQTGEDPIEALAPKMEKAWGDPSSVKTVQWPIHFRAARLHPS